MVFHIISATGLGKLPFSFVIFFMVMILLLGSSAIYGEIAGSMNIILIIYAVMLLIARSDFTKMEHKAQPIINALPAFFITFVITLLAMILIRPMIGGVLTAATLESGIQFAFAFGIMHALVKAYIEEEVFRGRLSVVFGEVGQAIIFGLFHFFILLFTLGLTPLLFVAIGWLILLGYIWGRVEDRFGLAGATGSHFGYNVVVFGMLPFLTGAYVI